MEKTSNVFPVDWANTLASIKKGTYIYISFRPDTLNPKTQVSYVTLCML